MLNIDAIKDRWPDPAPYPNQASRDVADLLAEIEALTEALDLAEGYRREQIRTIRFYRGKVRAIEAIVPQTIDGELVIYAADIIEILADETEKS